jgi:hypothetical protein
MWEDLAGPLTTTLRKRGRNEALKELLSGS